MKNYPFSRLELVVETFGQPTNVQFKSPKLLSQQIRKIIMKL